MKMDRRLVASEEDNGREVKRIAYIFKVPIKVLREVIKRLGADGNNARSMDLIYAELMEMGYKIIKERVRGKKYEDEPTNIEG
jgi:hypothetical protein